MSVPAELMAMLGGGGAPGGPGGRPQETGLPGQVPPGLEREPGDPEAELDEDPLEMIAEMLDIARDFVDREDVSAQGKRIMEDVTTKLVQFQATEEKAAQGPASLVTRGLPA